MSVKSNLDLARKYEWYAMFADAQGDKKLADRYSSFAKMSMIDACKGYSNNNSINPIRTTYSPPPLTKEEIKSPSFIIGLIVSSLFFIGIYIIGGII